MILWFKLILAHLLGDFLFQPDSWVEAKEKDKLRSWQLYTHTVIHFLLIMVLVPNLAFWKYALLLSFIHLAIDVSKLFIQSVMNKSYFFVDQIIHIVIITLIWISYENISVSSIVKDQNFFIVKITFIYSITKPASMLISSFISRWTPEDKNDVSDSLTRAGNWIGILERLFVFVFVVAGRWEAVGFLLTAKSVFRFGDLKDKKDRKLTEYVLIGTLLSFGISILAGIMFNKIKILI